MAVTSYVADVRELTSGAPSKVTSKHEAHALQRLHSQVQTPPS
jgi:hypothetical protein